MASIGQQPTEHQIIYDETPLELHATDILDRLAREGTMPFAEVFRGRQTRTEIVGLFLALLELIRQRKILVGQERNFGEIHMALNPEPPRENEDPNRADVQAPSAPEPESASSSASAATPEGRYVAENSKTIEEEPPDGNEATA